MEYEPNAESSATNLIALALRAFPGRVALACSGGKDSLTLVTLTARVCDLEGLPRPPLYFGDTGVLFPEVYDIVGGLAAEWEVVRPELATSYEEITTDGQPVDRAVCCLKLKIEPLVRAVKERGWRALVVGVRRSECAARAGTLPVGYDWASATYRVHPLFEWTEDMVRVFCRENKVRLPALYEQGYRSIGCVPCTKPGTPGGPERGGRAQDKEEIMRRLQRLGYWGGGE